MIIFKGVIESTTKAGREAIVLLDEEVSGKQYAVISYGTKGRVELMNGKGRLAIGAHVVGQGEDSIDALRATSVRALETAR